MREWGWRIRALGLGLKHLPMLTIRHSLQPLHPQKDVVASVLVVVVVVVVVSLPTPKAHLVTFDSTTMKEKGRSFS